MKIKNRNKNYKSRLLRNSCILAAGVLGISGATAGILSHISHGDAFATNQVIRRTGLNSIGENEIQMQSDIIKLSNATIVTTGQVKQMRSKCYTEAEIQNGTYDAERSSQVSYDSATKNYCDTLNIVYDFGNSLAPGTHDVDGTISLTWKDAAHDTDGHKYDVKMYIDNIKVANAFNATRPISIMAEREHSVRAAMQEVPASSLDSSYSYYGNNVGAYYDTMISVVEKNTNTPVEGKKTVYQMKDLDQPDYVTNNASPEIYKNGDSPAPFAEGIALVSGIDQEVFVGTNSILYITDTHFGNSTRFTGTAPTSGDQIENSSVAFRGDVSGFKYRWYGSNCVTLFGWIEAKKVVTSTSGQYKDNGRITPTDNEVLWKEDKSISAVPNPGYYVSKITVDGQEIDIPDPDGTGRVTYVFNDVTADHTIDAQFAPYNYKVTVRHYKEGTTTPVADPVVSDNHHAGETYTSHEETVNGYHVVTRPDPETVTFTDHDIEMIYYYAEDTPTPETYKVTVRHYKEGTTTPVADPVVSDNHHAGETYTSHEETVNGYHVVTRPDPETVTFTDHDIEMIYYYAEDTPTPETYKVTVRHYKEGTTTPVADPVVSDNHHAGETYTSHEETVNGYHVVTRPDPETVTFTDHDIEMIYYYAEDTPTPETYKVTVRHYKEGTTTPVADPVVSDNHHAGETYTSHEETVNGYHVVTRPDPETVTFTDHDIEMIYYYAEDTPTPETYKVTVRHYKEGTTTPVADPVVSDNHHAGETYTSHEETVNGYHVVTRPDPETVTFTDHDIEMIYYYAEDTPTPETYKVTVRHYKEGTTTPVADPVVSDNHHAGDTYTSQPADVDGYRLVERPDPETVTFTDRDIEMIYYYAPVGNITVEYCDVDTKKCDLTEIVTDEGIDGDESRVCVEKKFDGYNFVNKEGDDCILSKDTTKIKYWYKKQPKNPVTADINVGGYAAAALGLAATVTGALFFITKRR